MGSGTVYVKFAQASHEQSMYVAAKLKNIVKMLSDYIKCEIV